MNAIARLLLTSMLVAAAPARAADIENVLLGGKDAGPWWGGGIDSFGDGCRNIDRCRAAVGFHFFREPNSRKLRVHVAFTAGTAPYDAYNSGRRFPGDTKPESDSKVDARVTENGFAFDTKFHWSCEFVNLSASKDADCTRSWKNGFKEKFRIRILPAS